MPQRKEPFSTIFDLPVGAETVVLPNVGETLDSAMKRLKKRLEKYHSEDRYYRMKAVDQQIVIQRILKEHRGPLADYRIMKPGTMMLVQSKPTAAHHKKAARLCEQLNSTRSIAFLLSVHKPERMDIGFRIPITLEDYTYLDTPGLN